jgi:hypothetical protein
VTGGSRPPRPCPPWCSEHPCPASLRSFHISEGTSASLNTGREPSWPPLGSFHSYAVQDSGQPDGVSLYVAPWEGGSTLSGAIPARAAEAVARLAELLAGASPEAHREVAAAIRAELALLGGGDR